MQSPISPEQFRSIRKNLGLTQADLAEQLGLSTTWIGRMESGTAEIERRTELALLYLQTKAALSQLPPGMLPG